MSNARCFTLLLIIISFFCVSCIQAETISGEMFEQWGNEVLGRIDNYFGRSDGVYGKSVSDNSAEYAWGQGITLSANVAAARLDSGRLAVAEKQAQEMYKSYRCYYNGYWAYNASRYNCGDRYYDDNAWIALGFLELYEITDNSKYLNWAREILIFCMSGENGAGNNPAGGIRWHESDSNGASVCSTAPTILANLMTYQFTGIDSYLQNGKRLYWWLVDSDLRLSRWIYHETNQGPLGYQTGVMTQNAVRLFEITGEDQYFSHAQLMAASMEDEFINGTTHALNQHGKWGGHDMTNAYVDLYLLDGNQYWLDLAAGYLEFLYLNCVEPETGLYPDVWNITYGDYSEALIDNASVARSFLTLARTNGGWTTNSEFISRMAGRWTFDQAGGTVAYDSSSFANDGILTGSSFSFDTGSVAGKLNGALDFDGSDDYIDLPDGFANFRTGMTVSVWVYPTEVKNWARIIDIGNGPYDNNIMLARRGSSNDLYFEVYNRDTSGGKVQAAGAIELNKWQLFTAALDMSGNVVIYKNGSPVASGQTAIPVNIIRTNAYIGKSNWEDDANYKGRMDDLRIYNYPLSDEDVIHLYLNKGQAENPEPADNYLNIVESQVFSWTPDSDVIGFDVYIGTDYDSVDNANNSSSEYKGRQTQAEYAPDLSPEATYFWRIDQVFSSGISKGHIWSFTTAVLPTDNLMVYYNMDSDFYSGKSIIDGSTGTILSGNLIGTSVVSSGYLPEALAFDGSDDYIDLPDSFIDLTNGFTVSVWAYPTSVGNWIRFIDFGNGIANNNIIFARNGVSNTLTLEVYDGSSSGLINADGVIELNKWQLFTATLNPLGYARIFKNGELVATGRIPVPPVIVRTNNYIGKSNWADPYYKGNMDDFGFWDRPLTSPEINSIYKRGLAGLPMVNTADPFAPIAHWKFNEGSGDIVLDCSGNQYDGTFNNMGIENWGDGKSCGGVIFDGTDDYINVSRFKGIAGAGSRTCSAWIKTSDSNKYCMIIGWGDNSINNKWLVRVNSDGYFEVACWGGIITSNKAVNDNNWHHVAAVLENDGSANISEVKLFVDGVQAGIISNNSLSINTGLGSDLVLGAFIMDDVPLHLFEGSIDEVRVYSRALNADDVLQLYNEDALSADYTSDTVVNIEDFATLAFYWQDSDACETDLNCDCVVDINDLTIFVDQWISQ